MKQLIAILIVLLAAPVVFAGEGGNARHSNLTSMQRLAQGPLKGIDLTAAQKPQVEAIENAYAARQTEYTSKLKSLRDQRKAARDRGDKEQAAALNLELREMRRKVRSDYDSQLRAVLTPEQAKIFDANMAPNPKTDQQAAR